MQTLAAYCTANFGFGAFYAINNAVLPLWLKAYTHNAILRGLLAGTHTIEAPIVQPLVGALSDKLRWKMGRRKPFVVIFGVLAALLFALAPLAAHLPQSTNIAIIAALIFASTSSFNVSQDPYQAWLSDVTVVDQRGKVAAISQMIALCGQATILMLPIVSVRKIEFASLLLLVTVAITGVLTPDKPYDPATHPNRNSNRINLSEIKTHLGRLRQFRLFLLSSLFYGIGTGPVVPNITTFIEQMTKCSDSMAERLFLLLMLSALAASVPAGFMSDTIGFKRTLMISYGFITSAAIVALVAKTVPEFVIVMVLAGVGTALSNASNYPLLLSLVPNDDVGVFTGMQTAALGVGGPVALVGVGYLINRHLYSSVFITCAVGVIIAFIVLIQIKPLKAANEIDAAEAAS